MIHHVQVEHFEMLRQIMNAPTLLNPQYIGARKSMMLQPAEKMVAQIMLI